MFYSLCPFRATALFVIISMLTGCNNPLPERPPEIRNGELYGETEGLFRHQWWNYYERGLSFADGGFWPKAEADLREAMRQRYKDQWRARTYGMHLGEYFPHRELGVVLYKQGDLKQAIQELEISWNMTKSAKAAFYLDKARKARIEEEQSDTARPEIIIHSPKEDFLTGKFSILIKGKAKDDQYVRHIKVANKVFRVDVSEQEIDFQMEVALRPGENKIPIQIKDLAGKHSEKFVSVNVDNLGPLVSLDESLSEDAVAGKTILLKGYAFDDSGVAELEVNGQKFSYNHNLKELYFEKRIEIQPGKTELLVTLRDRLGNETSAKTALIHRSGEKADRTLLLAENSRYQEMADMPKTGQSSDLLAQSSPSLSDSILPEIKLKCPENLITYLDAFVIEGTIEDKESGVSFFSFEDEENISLKTPRKKYHFAFIAPLKEGENTIEIYARDAHGNPDSKRIRIMRKVPHAERIESRLELAVYRFDKESDSDSGKGFDKDLKASLKQGERFKVRELGMLPKDIYEASKIGESRDIDYILYGDFIERGDTVTIYASLWDTETDEDFFSKTLMIDVYEENVNADKLREMANMIHLKMADELPLVKGIVQKTIKGKKRIIVDIGTEKEKKIKEGMKLIVYKLDDPIMDETTGEVLDWNDVQLAKARIRRIRDTFSIALLYGDANETAIQPEHNVITQ